MYVHLYVQTVWPSYLQSDLCFGPALMCTLVMFIDPLIELLVGFLKLQSIVHKMKHVVEQLH